MRKQLNERQEALEMARKHVKGGGVVCPYCGGQDIEGGPVETGNEEATQEMKCLACRENWMDSYKLNGIYDENAEWVEPTPEPKKVYIDVDGGNITGVYGPAGLECLIIDADNGAVDEDVRTENERKQAEEEAAIDSGEIVELY